MSIEPEPGIYRNISFAEYVAWDAMNASTIKRAFLRNGEISMAHLKAYIDAPSKPQTEAMRFGTLAHVGRLEPIRLMQRYVVMPAFEQSPDNKTQAGKATTSKNTTYYREKVAEFEKANIGREPIEQCEFDRMLRIVEAIDRNAEARRYFECEGETELSIVWEDADTGELCKARIDKVARPLKALPDLKTCADMTRFEADIWNLQYHIQQSFYADGWAAVSGEKFAPVLIACESEQPHRTCAVPLSRRYTDIGRDQYKTVLSGYQKCKASGDWPFPPDPKEWNPPAWASSENEPTGMQRSIDRHREAEPIPY